MRERIDHGLEVLQRFGKASVLHEGATAFILPASEVIAGLLTVRDLADRSHDDSPQRYLGRDDVHDVEGLAHVREHLWGAAARLPDSGA